MRLFLKVLLVLLASMALVTEDAAARRMGGGGNFGRMRPNVAQPYQSRTAPQAAPAQNSANNGAVNRSPLAGNRWLGPLAGFAMGSLLGSMLFGHPFQGFQFFDMLMLLALGLGAYYLFRSLRRNAGPAVAGNAYQYAASPTTSASGGPSFEVPGIGSGLGGSSSGVQSSAALTTPSNTVPEWFDEDSFTKAAKTHFIRLQAAWDRGDMRDIQEYTTPQLFAELSMERQSLAGPQHTEVVSLNTEILDVATEGNEVIVSVRYSGQIREDANGPVQSFSEIWHVQRALNDSQANWYIGGIQQVS